MWLLSVIILVPLAWFGYRQIRTHRRRAIAERDFPDAWRGILERNVPLYVRLPDAFKQELYGHIHLFLHDKRFHGFDGIEVDDEMRVTIAGNACILLLNRPSDHYSGFTSIYIYPSTFVGRHTKFDGQVKHVGEQARLGESWHRGPLVLAWDAVLHGTLDVRDGHNVVLHEFAHKLDGADGQVDGAPILNQRSHYAPWTRVMTREYAQLRKHAQQGARTVMDHYGATEPAEFFAVLTETFYEKPRQLRDEHPELYAEMQRCFNVDPLAWLEAELDARNEGKEIKNSDDDSKPKSTGADS